MAFMVPVVRQDYDIYGSRSRNISTCSSRSRSRKSSECKSEPLSMSVSPQDNFLASSPGRKFFSGRLSRTSSRGGNAGELISPTSNTAPSTPKSSSNTSLDKFHNKVVDKLKKALKISDSTEEGPQDNDVRATS